MVACPSSALGQPACVCVDGYASSSNSQTNILPFSSNQYRASCTAVVCPADSDGPAVVGGCSCITGYSGVVAATSVAPNFFTSTCSIAPCPANAFGAPSCQCNDGYYSSADSSSNILSFDMRYTATCVAFTCPPNSFGTNEPLQCTCKDGYNGAVLATSTAPFFVSTCMLVTCPGNSTGQPSCRCIAGYKSSGNASTSALSFNTTTGTYTTACQPVLCPENSVGVTIPTGCSCNRGYNGNLTAIQLAPFFASGCVAVPCPVNSVGTSVISALGCSCDVGYSGVVVVSNSSPFFTSTCIAVSCPAAAWQSKVFVRRWLRRQ